METLNLDGVSLLAGVCGILLYGILWLWHDLTWESRHRKRFRRNLRNRNG